MTETAVKLLLVEDENDFRDSCARWMKQKGHRVTDVCNAVEALELLEKEQFDVAVFDLNMPGMSGLELLQRVHDQDIDTEVIMLTGQGTVEAAVFAMRMGAYDFLNKPCTLGDLEIHCVMARERGAACERKTNSSRPSSAASGRQRN